MNNTETPNAAKPLPRWQCHKRVHADKITEISETNEEGVCEIILQSSGILPVTLGFMQKHNPQVGGYIVIYDDGYHSYSPAEPFESGYLPLASTSLQDEKPPHAPALLPPNNRTFGDAIEALKAGKRVSRAGWNGKGMYLWLLPAAMVKAEWCREPHLKVVAEQNGGEVECLGSIRMWTVNSDGRRAVLTGWLASQTDMLAEDWTILP